MGDILYLIFKISLYKWRNWCLGKQEDQVALESMTKQESDPGIDSLHPNWISLFGFTPHLLYIKNLNLLRINEYASV